MRARAAACDKAALPSIRIDLLGYGLVKVEHVGGAIAAIAKAAAK